VDRPGVHRARGPIRLYLCCTAGTRERC
jgi:hypothetical protein